MRSRHVAAAFLCVLAVWQLAEAAYIPIKAVAAQVLLRDAWSQTRSTQQSVRPWPWADTWPVARLRVVEHGVDLVVLSGITGSTLAFGPGHMDGSALPGELGHTVLSGHRDTHFKFLANLKGNETLILELPDGGRRSYQVMETEVVDIRDGPLRLNADAEQLTLITCYPFDAIDPGGPLRLLVTARLNGETIAI